MPLDCTAPVNELFTPGCAAVECKGSVYPRSCTVEYTPRAFWIVCGSEEYPSAGWEAIGNAAACPLAARRDILYSHKEKNTKGKKSFLSDSSVLDADKKVELW